MLFPIYNNICKSYQNKEKNSIDHRLHISGIFGFNVIQLDFVFVFMDVWKILGT